MKSQLLPHEYGSRKNFTNFFTEILLFEFRIVVNDFFYTKMNDHVYNKVLLQKKTIESNFAHSSYSTKIYFFVTFSGTRHKYTYVKTKTSK